MLDCTMAGRGIFRGCCRRVGGLLVFDLEVVGGPSLGHTEHVPGTNSTFATSKFLDISLLRKYQ